MSFELDSLWVHPAILLIIQYDFYPKRSICLHSRSENSFSVGFLLTRPIMNQNNIGFELAAFLKPSRTVSATIQLRFRDFSKIEFLLVLSQPIGFRDEWTSDSDSPSSKTYDGLFSDIPRNTAIPLVGNRGGLGGGRT